MDKQRFREMKHAAGICYCDFTPVLIVALASVIGACYLATIHEALNLAERLKTLPEGVIRSPSGSPGEAFTLPAATGADNWHGALFARSDLAKAFLALQRGQVSWPGQAAVFESPASGGRESAVSAPAAIAAAVPGSAKQGANAPRSPSNPLAK